MKKLGKFLAGVATLAGLAAGAFYVYKNYVADSSEDEVDDIDDLEIEDEVAEETEAEDREYISISIAPEETEATAEKTEEN